MSKSNPYAAPARGHQKPVEAPEVETVDETQVPDGTIAEVLEWVGEDQERANVALEHEVANHKRKTLIEALDEKLTAGDPSALVPTDEENENADEEIADESAPEDDEDE